MFKTDSVKLMNQTVQNILETYWDAKIPIDPDFIAEKLGLSIIKDDLSLKPGYLDVEKKEIYVNCEETTTRQRFVIARELGHYCLGHNCSFYETSDARYRIFSEEQKEEANQFALDLLMPAAAVKAVMDGMGIRDVKRIREMFDVSAKVLQVRLLQLGYINL